MLSNGGRRILVLVDALMQMPPCVTNINCITQVTFKLINKGLLVDNGRLDFGRFQMLFNLVANKYGLQLPAVNNELKAVPVVLPFMDQSSADIVRAQLKDLSQKVQVTVQPIFVNLHKCVLSSLLNVPMLV